MVRRGGRPCVFRGAHRKALAQTAGVPATEAPDPGGLEGGAEEEGGPMAGPCIFCLLCLLPSLSLIPSLACCHGAVLPPAHLTPDKLEPLAPPLCSLGRYPLGFQSPKSQVLPKRVEGSPVHSAIATEAASPAPHSIPATSAHPQAVRVGSRVNSELSKPLCSPGLGRPL